MMDQKHHEVMELKLDDLISFQLQPTRTYQGERLKQFARAIEREGLLDSIIVRPTNGGKYEIICGHNRVAAMKKLGRDVIRAEVWEGLSDDEAIELFYDSNLNQQSFSDWSYSQKIKAIQYIDTLIKENSQQGKRYDLAKQDAVTENGTSVHSRHKSDKSSRRSTTRDRMSRRLGIATATLSKYRKIIQLPDDLLEVMARMLDEKKISLEAAYRMTGLSHNEIEWLLEYVDESPDKKIDMARLKELATRGKAKDTENQEGQEGTNGSEQSKDTEAIKESLKAILVPREPC